MLDFSFRKGFKFRNNFEDSNYAKKFVRLYLVYIASEVTKERKTQKEDADHNSAERTLVLYLLVGYLFRKKRPIKARKETDEKKPHLREKRKTDFGGNQFFNDRTD